MVLAGVCSKLGYVAASDHPRKGFSTDSQQAVGIYINIQIPSIISKFLLWLGFARYLVLAGFATEDCDRAFKEVGYDDIEPVLNWLFSNVTA